VHEMTSSVNSCGFLVENFVTGVLEDCI